MMIATGFGQPDGRRDLLAGSVETDRKHRGFTLTEILLVVIVIAVMAAGLAVSVGSRRDEAALRLSAEDLAAAARFAVTQSDMTGAAHRLTLSEDLAGFWVEVARPGGGRAYSPAEGRAGRLRRLPEGVRVTAIITQQGGRLSAQADDILFGPEGAGFAGRIELTNRAGSQAMVEVLPTAGQANVIR